MLLYTKNVSEDEKQNLTMERIMRDAGNYFSGRYGKKAERINAE